MKVCVLQPDYVDSMVDYRNYDPRRSLAHLLPGCTVDHIFLKKTSVYHQIRETARKGYDIYVNLCEGYLEWDIPSVDVIWSLENLGLPYTGPSIRLYDPSKPLMKYVAYTQGVLFPAFVEASTEKECLRALDRLRFPLFVKPSHAGDSLGIDAASLVKDEAALMEKCARILGEFDRILIEEYIEGREFTVLVAGNPDDPTRPLILKPLEFLFRGDEQFKTYDLKIHRHHAELNVPVEKPETDARLREAARLIFTGFLGEGYSRMDFRMDVGGDIYFLDINFACSIFYDKGHEGSADYILNYDPMGASGFLRHVIEEGRARYLRRRKKYERRGDSISGFGIYAREDIPKGDTIFRGEERPHRLVTRSHVEKNWPADQIEVFRRYAFPVSEEAFIIWDENPDEWAPQNHSCDPNTAYDGLNVVALKDIRAGEELTLDYAAFCDEHMMPFDCRCGSDRCRTRIVGTPRNSVSYRESSKRNAPQTE